MSNFEEPGRHEGRGREEGSIILGKKKKGGGREGGGKNPAIVNQTVVSEHARPKERDGAATAG